MRAHWPMVLVGGEGGRAEGEVCILRSPGIVASPIYLLSMRGVSSLEGNHAPSI